MGHILYMIIPGVTTSIFCIFNHQRAYLIAYYSITHQTFKKNTHQQGHSHIPLKNHSPVFPLSQSLMGASVFTLSTLVSGSGLLGLSGFGPINQSSSSVSEEGAAIDNFVIKKHGISNSTLHKIRVLLYMVSV